MITVVFKDGVNRNLVLGSVKNCVSVSEMVNVSYLVMNGDDATAIIKRSKLVGYINIPLFGKNKYFYAETAKHILKRLK